MKTTGTLIRLAKEVSKLHHMDEVGQMKILRYLITSSFSTVCKGK